jgi:hypothetical protein
MKLIITESKLYNVFVKYMDSQMDLSYNIRSREFIDKDNHSFGWLNGTVFMFGELSDQHNLEDLFGHKTSRMLLSYLRDRFPDSPINFIE